MAYVILILFKVIMRFIKTIFIIISLLTLISACNQSQLDVILQELDKTIAERNIYRDSLDKAINIDRKALYSALTLNDKYMYADRLFLKYMAENADSAIYYANLSYSYASQLKNDTLQLKSMLDRILIPVEEDITRCRAYYEALDEHYIYESFGKEALISYLYCGAELYKFIVNNESVDNAYTNERYDYYRRRYCEENPESLDAIRFKSALMNNQGRYDESLELIKAYINGHSLDNYGYSIMYNRMASTYASMGDGYNARIMYARSAIYNLKRPAKQYHSLSLLALLLMEDKEYDRALKYINVASSDAISSGYDFRISETSSYLLTISGLVKENEKIRRLLLYMVVGLLLIFLISSIGGIVLLSKYSTRLKKSYDIISDNNMQLADLNRIKENCMLKYMVNCTNYIKAIDENNSTLRKALKAGGLDAVKSELRKPGFSSHEFKNFYHEFDTNFLKMYPTFVDEINKIMPDDHKFPPCSDGNLTMDLRIMAVIRIGIKSSGTIANFLNYAPSTVYTSRTKIKKASLLDGDEFDSYIEKIGI